MGMLQKKIFLYILSLLFCAQAWAQKAMITGIIRDERGTPLDQVVIANEVTGYGSYSNAKGYYMFEMPAGKSITIIWFSGLPHAT